MKAAVFGQFRGPIQVCEVASPAPREDAVIIDVRACGVCRSDWHAWMGHDSDVRLPHVPGHELAGTVAEVGGAVRRWQPGDRVTVPFCCGCGSCRECQSGNHHICDSQTQPGFTHWGAFAERVEIRFADINLVALPDRVDFVTAASLGCRFATSFRAIIHQARTVAGDRVAVHGCGGVGLSAIMIARAAGAEVIAVDISQERLAMAKRLGASECVDASQQNVVDRIREITLGGAQVSIDALGSHVTCRNSIDCLAKRGRHVQVGLLLGDQADPPVPMAAVIANELEIYGSHGMQASQYAPMMRMIADGRLNPGELISDTISLEQAAQRLPQMDRFPGTAMAVIRFE